MADCLLSLIFDEPFERYGDLGLAHRQGNRIARFSPFNTYRTADGAVAIGAGTAADWTKLLKIIGREDLLCSPEFMNPGWRIENNTLVDAVVGQWAAGLPIDDIIRRLDEADITCGPIRTIEDVVSWDQLRARDMLQPVRNPNIPSAAGPLAAGFPLKFSEADAFHDPHVPLPREHNAEIYEGLLKLSKEAIANLSKGGVV
jgi:crotonobetainyl-CoA:carnitine CoA-transferase CaiB-like acyl-CoA transferase